MSLIEKYKFPEVHISQFYARPNTPGVSNETSKYAHRKKSLERINKTHRIVFPVDKTGRTENEGVDH